MATFGVVIPVLNQQTHLHEALSSILFQSRNHEIRVHVQDGGSTDKTPEILSEWAKIFSDTPNIFFSYATEVDEGVPEALNRGFKKVSGDYLTWLGADDIFFPNAFTTVAALGERFPQFEWVTGMACHISEESLFLNLSGRQGILRAPSGFSQRRLSSSKSVGGFWPIVQQEGTFWTSKSFDRVGGSISEDYKLAFDFELWTRLAQEYRLLQVAAPLAAFRKRTGQLSADSGSYRQEVKRIQNEIRYNLSHLNQFARGSKLHAVASFDYRSHEWNLKESRAQFFVGSRVWRKLSYEIERIYRRRKK